MLKRVASKRLAASKGRFVIVAANYNAQYVDAMLRAARSELARAGTKKVEVIRVPGAFEIPLVAARIASVAARHRGSTGDRLGAIICLGVILRGETVHAAHIGEAVSQALMQIQVRYRFPVIHEVLLLENHSQAKVRCLGARHNRGAEAAQTALIMAEVMNGMTPDPDHG